MSSDDFGKQTEQQLERSAKNAYRQGRNARRMIRTLQGKGQSVKAASGMSKKIATAGVKGIKSIISMIAKAFAYMSPVLVPMLIISICLLALFSFLLGNDPTREKPDTAQNSYVGKLALHLADYNDAVSIFPNHTAVLSYDSEIQRKNGAHFWEFNAEKYRKVEQSLLLDETDESKFGESEYFGEEIPYYSDIELTQVAGTMPVGETIFLLNISDDEEVDKDHKATIDKLRTKNSNDEEVVGFRILKEDDIATFDEETYRNDAKKADGFDGYGAREFDYETYYIPDKNVVQTFVPDPLNEYNIQDEYKILTESIRVILSDQYNKAKADLDKMVKELEQPNKAQLKDILLNEFAGKFKTEGFFGSVTYFNEQENKGKKTDVITYIDGKLDKNSADPNLPEYNIDYLAEGTYNPTQLEKLTRNMASQLAAYYPISKGDTIPDSSVDGNGGYYDNLDATFIRLRDYLFKPTYKWVAENKQRTVLTQTIETTSTDSIATIKRGSIKEAKTEAEKKSADYKLVEMRVYTQNETVYETSGGRVTEVYVPVKKGEGTHISGFHLLETFPTVKKGSIKKVVSSEPVTYDYIELKPDVKIMSLDVNAIAYAFFFDRGNSFFDVEKSYIEENIMPYQYLSNLGIEEGREDKGFLGNLFRDIWETGQQVIRSLEKGLASFSSNLNYGHAQRIRDEERLALESYNRNTATALEQLLKYDYYRYEPHYIFDNDAAYEEFGKDEGWIEDGKSGTTEITGNEKKYFMLVKGKAKTQKEELFGDSFNYAEFSGTQGGEYITDASTRDNSSGSTGGVGATTSSIQGADQEPQPVVTSNWNGSIDNLLMNAVDPAYVTGDYINKFFEKYYPNSVLVGHGDLIKQKADQYGINVAAMLGQITKETGAGSVSCGGATYNFGCIMASSWTDEQGSGRIYAVDREWANPSSVEAGVDLQFKLMNELYVQQGYISYKDFLNRYSPTFENDQNTFKNIMYGVVVNSFGQDVNETKTKGAGGTQSITSSYKVATSDEFTYFGDSLVAGSINEFNRVFQNSNNTTNGVPSRRMTTGGSNLDGVSVFKEMIQNGEVRKNVLVYLGTNGGLDARELEEFIKAAGDRQLFFITTSFDLWRGQVKGELDKVAEKYQNVHILDWAKYVDVNGGISAFYGSDNVHFTAEGNKALMQFVASTLSSSINPIGQGASTWDGKHKVGESLTYFTTYRSEESNQAIRDKLAEMGIDEAAAIENYHREYIEEHSNSFINNGSVNSKEEDIKAWLFFTVGSKKVRKYFRSQIPEPIMVDEDELKEKIKENKNALFIDEQMEQGAFAFLNGIVSPFKELSVSAQESMDKEALHTETDEKYEVKTIAVTKIKEIKEKVLEYHYNQRKYLEDSGEEAKTGGSSRSKFAGGSSSGGDNPRVKLALSEVGKNLGGQKFWSFMGFGGRVEWCACFTSWLADQSGLIEGEGYPKHAAVQGWYDWAVQNNRYHKSSEVMSGKDSYVPKAGDMIVYDWDGDGVFGGGSGSHINMLINWNPEEKKMETIGGNESDEVRQSNMYNYAENGTAHGFIDLDGGSVSNTAGGGGFSLATIVRTELEKIISNGTNEFDRFGRFGIGLFEPVRVVELLKNMYDADPTAFETTISDAAANGKVIKNGKYILDIATGKTEEVPLSILRDIQIVLDRYFNEESLYQQYKLIEQTAQIYIDYLTGVEKSWEIKDYQLDNRTYLYLGMIATYYRLSYGVENILEDDTYLFDLLKSNLTADRKGKFKHISEELNNYYHTKFPLELNTYDMEEAYRTHGIPNNDKIHNRIFSYAKRVGETRLSAATLEQGGNYSGKKYSIPNNPIDGENHQNVGEFDMLAYIIGVEAGYENEEAIDAVTSVIFNRADRSNTSPYAEATKKNQFSAYWGEAGTESQPWKRSLNADLSLVKASIEKHAQGYRMHEFIFFYATSYFLNNGKWTPGGTFIPNTINADLTPYVTGKKEIGGNTFFEPASNFPFN